MENKFFSSSNVQMWELDHKEGWVPKNWYFQIVVLEKTPERPFDCKKMKPVNRKGNQPWILIGRTDAEAEAPIPWPPVAKSWLIGKDPDAGKDWGQEEKGMTERMRWLDSSHIIWFVGKIYLLLQVKKLKKTLRIGERRGKCICKGKSYITLSSF